MGAGVLTTGSLREALAGVFIREKRVMQIQKCRLGGHVMQKQKLSGAATRQGCQGLLATPEAGGGEGQWVPSNLQRECSPANI